MAEHQIVKPEKIASAAAVALEQQVIVPGVFRREGIEQFKGAKNDTINVRVEGVLPFRSYGWRADRSQEVQFDEYAERTVAVTFGDDLYSGVKLTDEQNEMDFDGWTKLAVKQTDAIARGMNHACIDELLNAPYEVELGLDPANLRKGLIKARQTMNRLMVPEGRRVMLVGTDIEAALLEDEKLNLASNVGESEAVSALREATLGRRYGFDFVVAQELPPGTAIALVDSAFVVVTGAPSVPQSVPFGASGSADGWAVRWIRDYDSTRFQDRSIFNTYFGTRHVPDVLVGRDAAGQAYVSNYEHFVRAIKINLGGDDVLPDPDGDDERATELGNITGLWAEGDGFKSTDEAVIQESTITKVDGSKDTPATPKKARDEA
jgi:hypothetical protein